MNVRRPLERSRLDQLIAEVEPLKRGFDLLVYHTVITDENANILYANRAVETHTGYKPEDILGKNPGDLWGGRMDEEFYREMWRTIKAEKMPYLGEIKNVNKSGREYWQEIIISPVFKKDGNIKFFIALEPIITERKEKEKFQSEFVTILSHQLQKPLTAIKWSLELLKEQGGLMKAEQVELLENIYQNDKSLIDLVADLLVLSRIGRTALKPEVIDLTTEIKANIQVQKKFYPKVVCDESNIPEILITVRSKTLAQQVIQNLVSNAFKYSRNKVVVGVEIQEKDRVLVVRNDGEALQPSEQPHVFEQLFRGVNSKDRPGTGIGLYIVKLICDSFNWQITFQSPTPEGETVFKVRIPDSGEATLKA